MRTRVAALIARVGLTVAVASVGLVWAATPSQAACEWQWSTYTALSAEALATGDADLAIRANYWYQDWEACMAREAARPTPRPSFSTGTPTNTGGTVTRPTPLPAAKSPQCTAISQPTPRGRQTDANSVQFTWDPVPGVTDYRVNTRTLSQGVWGEWTGYGSIGTATTHTVNLPAGGAVALTVVASCSGPTGLADGKIYPVGTVTSWHAERFYLNVVPPTGWSCAQPDSSGLASCSRTFTYPRKDSIKASRSVANARNEATTSLTAAGINPTAPLGIQPSRGKRGQLNVLVTASVTSRLSDYQDATFSPRG
jgi:hypothetical protein